MKFISKVKELGKKVVEKSKYAVTAAAMMLTSTTQAYAFDSATVTVGDPDPATSMGAVIGILLTITRYAGVALIIFGAYEIVMSFMQNQPEAKTKGIIMALCGIVMVAMKSLLTNFGISIA